MRRAHKCRTRQFLMITLVFSLCLVAIPATVDTKPTTLCVGLCVATPTELLNAIHAELGDLPQRLLASLKEAPAGGSVAASSLPGTGPVPLQTPSKISDPMTLFNPVLEKLRRVIDEKEAAGQDMGKIRADLQQAEKMYRWTNEPPESMKTPEITHGFPEATYKAPEMPDTFPASQPIPIAPSSMPSQPSQQTFSNPLSGVAGLPVMSAPISGNGGGPGIFSSPGGGMMQSTANRETLELVRLVDQIADDIREIKQQGSKPATPNATSPTSNQRTRRPTFSAAIPSASQASSPSIQHHPFSEAAIKSGLAKLTANLLEHAFGI